MEKVIHIVIKQPKFIRDLFINAYGFLLKRKRFDKKFWEYYRFLKDEHQYWPVEKLREEQLNSLIKMVNYAYNNVEYYREVFDEYGISPKTIQDFEDFKKIPFLTRDDVIKNKNKLISKKFKGKLIRSSSSGTTGQKLVFYLPKEIKWSLNFAYYYLICSWSGIRPFDRRVTLGGRVFASKPPYWTYNRFENQLLLSIHHLNPKTAIEYLELIKWFRPKYIQGHPSGIAYLSEIALENDVFIPVEVIHVTGETLYEDQIDLMKKAFGASVHQTYGLGELGVIAGTCKEMGYFHELTDYNYIEILNDGKIIGTSLQNYGMPFIRYFIGDIGVPASESSEICSVTNYPAKLKKIEGRIDDIIRIGKRVILPVSIRMAIKPYLEMGENYQLIQISEKEFRLNFQYRRAKNRLSNLQLILYSTIKRIIGIDNLKLEIYFVEQLPHTGKIRNVISLTKHSG